MKAGWKEKPLEDITTSINGLWKGKKPPFQNARVIRNTNFRTNGKLNLDDVAEIEVQTSQFSKRQLEYGDIILERSGGGPKQPVGRVVCFELEDDDFSFSNFTSVVRVADKENLDYRYLHKLLNFWYYSGVTESLQKQSTGIRNLDFKTYKALMVPVPPLDEQRRIVAILDEAFEGLDRARAHTEANLQNARDLFESVLSNVFEHEESEFEIKRLDDICDVRDGTHDSPKYVSEGVPLVTQKNVRDEGLTFKKCKNISLADHEKIHKRSNVSEGDILISMIGVNRGMTCLVDVPDVFSIKNVGLIKRTDEFNMNYLLYYLKSRPALEYVSAETNGGAQPFIGLKKLRAFPVAYAPIQSQNKSVSFLDGAKEESDKLVALYKTKLTDLDDLRQSLLQKAFAGELT